MFAITNSAGLFGMNAFSVTVEAEVSKGRPNFIVSGLPDMGVRESCDRVRSAVNSIHIPFPNGKVLVNLAPADVKKSGSSFDLAIFVSLMQAMGVLPDRIPDSIFIGELGLHGVLHGIHGVLTITMQAREKGYKNIFVPIQNVKEASVTTGINVYGVENVEQLINHLTGDELLKPAPPYQPEAVHSILNYLDMEDVKGQPKAKNGIEIAAAGGHNILLIGSPGSGKSMLAQRVPTILPDMTKEEILETSNIYSVAGQLNEEKPLIQERPFRAPHHTISSAGLIGGGAIPSPGEISLAHNGVLFLDELPEFDRSTLEVLRQPLESRKIVISRAAGTAVYPCNIMLIAAMNPCPCGYYGSKVRQCTCSEKQVISYMGKISGPLLDRFDMHIDVDPVKYEDLASTEKAESSSSIRERIERARERQAERFKNTEIYSNAMIPDHLLGEYCHMNEAAKGLLRAVHAKYAVSARAFNRIQRVALSVADTLGHSEILRSDLAMAVQYRGFNSKYLLN